MAIFKIRNKNEFDKLVTIIKDNNSTAITVDEKGNIVSNGNYYVKAFNTDEETYTEEIKDETTFKRFDAFYTQTPVADTWEIIKESAINTFFARRNFLVYSPIKVSIDEKIQIEKIKEYLRLLAPNVNQSILTFTPSSRETEVVYYEVAVKFAIKFNGEPVYVINKFYFDGNYNLVNPNKISYLNNSIEREAKKHVESTNIESTNIESSIVNDFYDKIFAVMQTDAEQYLVGNALKTYTEGLKTITQSDKMIVIECGLPKFRYVAKLSMYQKKYIIRNSITNEAILECDIDSNNDVIFKCLQCNTEGICTNNKIKCYINEFEHEYREIDFSKSSDYYTNNELSKHLNDAPCPSCNRYVCFGKYSTCPSCDKTICIDCINPTMLIKTKGSDYQMHRKCAFYCTGTLKFVSKKDSRKCQCCGKVYSRDYFYEKSNLCKLCAPILLYNNQSIEVRNRVSELFQIHKKMFPLTKQLKNGICNEDLNGILFQIDTEVYYYDKKENSNSKYIKLKKL